MKPDFYGIILNDEIVYTAAFAVPSNLSAPFPRFHAASDALRTSFVAPMNR
jgi:hypothetical protein